MAKQIEIKNLTYSYDGEMNILKNLSLEVVQGEFIGIIGKSGSGKSTLLKFFNGILRDNKNSVKILDKEINLKTKGLKELRRKIGVVFQFPDEQLFEENIKEDIIFALKIHGFSEKQIIEELETIKELFSLTENMLEKSAIELSGGEKRRASIAGVVIYSPEILVLDEPTIGLDSQSKKKLMEILKKLNETGKTIIVVSHDLDNLWENIKRVVYLEDGIKAYDGEKKGFLNYSKESKNVNKMLPNYIQIVENNFSKGILTKKEGLEFIKEQFERWQNER
ncbi:MAG: energy-coupling factor ABC transporter ATP-binding protein [Fusobacteriaceae bacterium]